MKNSIASQLDWTATIFIENGTLHGLNVYKLIKNRKVRNVTFYLAAFALLCLPIVLVYETLQFFGDSAIKSTVEWKTEDSLNVPNVTICHPNYFSIKKMSDFNISSPLANYMVYGINTALREHLSIMLQNENYRKLLANMDIELQQKLQETQMKFPDLVRAIGISLEDFLSYCEIPYQDSYTNGCSQLFDPVPIFSPLGGICWTSKWNYSVESVVSADPIKIWTNIKRDESFQLDFDMHGTNAVERLAPVLALPLNNYPIGPIFREPIKLPLNEILKLGLTKTVIDRSGLNGQTFSMHKDMCVKSNEAFEAQFKIPYTEANCGSTLVEPLLQNCTMSFLNGLPLKMDKRPCEPMDFISNAQNSNRARVPSSAQLSQSFQSSSGPPCPKECIFHSYDKVLSLSEGNLKLMTEYLNRLPFTTETMRPEDISGLEIAFSTMESSTTSRYRDTLAVFLSQVGGWLGLCIGASVLSLVELAIFFMYLFQILYRSIFRQF